MSRIFATFIFISFATGGAIPPRDSLITTVIVTQPSNCTIARSAWKASEKCTTPPCGCTNEYLQTWAAVGFCNSGRDITNVSGPAFGQYAVNEQADKCRSKGFPVENVRVQLSSPQAAFLANLYLRDEHIRQKQTAFFALHVAGSHVGLALLVVLSIFPRKVRRDWTFFNFCITWIFSSVVFCLLLYGGTKGHTFNNPYGDEFLPFSHRCVVQASLVNGAQVMTSCSTMALVIQLWLNLRTAIYNGSRSPMRSRLMTAALLLGPYFLFALFAIPSIFIADNAVMVPNLINIFYCTIQSGLNLVPFLRAVYGVTVILLLVTFVFDVLILRIIYLHWRTFRRFQIRNPISKSILLRIIIFSIYRIVVAGSYVIAMFSSQAYLGSSTNRKTGVRKTFVNLEIPVPVDILQATIPIVAFLVLGTHKETITSLIFWRKEPVYDTSEDAEILSSSANIDHTRAKQDPLHYAEPKI